MGAGRQEISVANGKTIALPNLTEDDEERAKSPEMRIYIRQGVHHPNWIGWPNGNDDFNQTGVLIQTLDDQTARVLLVIDEAVPLNTLAVLKCAYEHLGYILHIDYATVLRQLSKDKDKIEDAPSGSLPSMEVA